MNLVIKFFNPNIFSLYAKKLLPIFSLACIIFISTGLYYALYQSPEDYQQAEMVRVMYVHVPSAWMSLAIYSFIAVCSLSSLIWQTKLSYFLAIAAAPIGATFAFITLATGSLWGKPIWGTWWVWDARLTSMLVLFLLYLSYITVVNSGNSIMRAEKPASVMAIIGFINVPIVKFSVDIWYSLHQPASVLKLSGPAIHHSMLMPLLLMFAGFVFLFASLLIMRTLTIISDMKSRKYL